METTAYVNGDKTRLVSSPKQRVAAEFDGFKPASAVTADAGRAELQAQAKALGIKANQSSEALAEQIAAFKPSGDAADSVDGDAAPETNDSGSPLPPS